MVNSFVSSLMVIIFTLSSATAFGQKVKTPTPNPAPVPVPEKATGKSVTLTQKDVAELVLKQGFRTKEVNLASQQLRLPYVQALAGYDWNFLAESGFEYDNSAYLMSNLTANQNLKYERYRTTATLQKPFTTGTLLGLELSRLSQKTDYGTTVNVPPAQQTLDIAGITLEQALFGNFLGAADRGTVNAAEYAYKASQIVRTNDLENVVLEAIRQFWTAYVAQENFKEATASRDRYKQLVDSVKRKTGLGYSAPGELSQVQAEYEGREQTVKTASRDYLLSTESLLTLLNIEPGTEIQFSVPQEIPAVPRLAPKKVEDLRAIRSQRLKVDAAKEALSASKSKSYPTLNLVGKAYTSGADETADGSYSELSSGSRPKYYIGVKLAYKFGSDVLGEDILNKKLTSELEETRLQRQLLESEDSEVQALRNVETSYSVAQSTSRQKVFREKAANELTRSFNQGRTDIAILIEALNKFFNSEVAYSQAVGNYAIALNEWAAIRDELIPDDQAPAEESLK